MLNKIIRFFLENKLVTLLVLTTFVIWGVITSSFGHDTEKHKALDDVYKELPEYCLNRVE